MEEIEDRHHQELANQDEVDALREQCGNSKWDNAPDFPWVTFTIIALVLIALFG